MLLGYLVEIKKNLSKEQFHEVLKMVEEDVKFNRVSFGKTTTGLQFGILFKRCLECLNRC